MKKTYLKPERTITVTSFNRHILTSESGNKSVIVTKGGGSGTLNDEEASGAAMSRSFNAWDED